MPEDQPAPAARDASRDLDDSLRRIRSEEEERTRRDVVARSDFRTPRIHRTLQIAALLALGGLDRPRDDFEVVALPPEPKPPRDLERFTPAIGIPPRAGKLAYVRAAQAREQVLARGELAADPKGYDADGGTVQRPGPLRRAFANSIPKESKASRRMRRRNKKLRR